MTLIMNADAFPIVLQVKPNYPGRSSHVRIISFCASLLDGGDLPIRDRVLKDGLKSSSGSAGASRERSLPRSLPQPELTQSTHLSSHFRPWSHEPRPKGSRWTMDPFQIRGPALTHPSICLQTRSVTRASSSHPPSAASASAASSLAPISTTRRASGTRRACSTSCT